jgi:hypothetical protein
MEEQPADPAVQTEEKKPLDPETEEEAERKGQSLLSENEKIGLGILFSFFKNFLPPEETPAQAIDTSRLPHLPGPTTETPQRRRGRSAPSAEKLRTKVRELLRKGFTEFRSKGSYIYARKKDEKTGKWVDAYVGPDSVALREILQSFRRKVST